MATLYDAAGKTCWITVTQEFSTRSLLLDGCEEGAMRLDSDEPVFAYLWFHKCSHLAGAPVGKALVLGAGAGTSAKCLALDYPQADIDAVDLEPDLAMIARKFFRLDQTQFARIRFHGMPAEEFLKTVPPPHPSPSPAGGEGRVRGPGSYDFVFDDLFDGFQHVPDSARTPAHLEMLRSVLSPGGICVKNVIWDPFSANSRAACAEVQSHWQKCFPSNLGLALGDPEKGHNFILVGTTAGGALAWPAAKEKLCQAGMPRSVLDGIRPISG
jgi:spermidine synthase